MKHHQFPTALRAAARGFAPRAVICPLVQSCNAQPESAKLRLDQHGSDVIISKLHSGASGDAGLRREVRRVVCSPSKVPVPCRFMTSRFLRYDPMVRSFRHAAAIAAASALSLATLALSASAADLAGNCCADLEERIAELEATTARKGNRKVSLTVSGQVNKALLLWDDGSESNAYVVGNKNDQTNFGIAGDAKIAPGVTAGYEIVLRLLDNLSDGVDQTLSRGDTGFDLWQAHWFIESETLGKVSVGKASRVTDTAPEADFSEAGVAGYAGVQDGALADVAWGDIYSHFNGDTANLVRYDSPSFGGFVVSASWGEDDIWDAGIRYAYEGNGINFEAVVAYTEVTDEGGEPGRVDEDTVVGSASILHEASGLNFTVAAGQKSNNVAVADLDGVTRAQDDAKFIYVKAGWIAKLNALGPTAFYGEYGVFEDFISAGADAGVVASLASGASGCVAAGAACRVTGNEADVWGFGVVQHIEAAEMQLYLGYRRHSADFDLVDGAGGAAGTAQLEDFDTVISGAKISF